MPPDMAINIRCTDLEPVKRLIEAMAAVVSGCHRDGYDSHELVALHDAIAEIRATPQPVPPSPTLMLDGDGRPSWSRISIRASSQRIFEPCERHRPSVDDGHGYPIDCPDCWANAPR